MKVALMLTGLARKVQEGYDNYWEHIIETNDVDLYLHAWESDEYKIVPKVYKKYETLTIEKPFKFTEHRKGIESLDDDKSRPLLEYDVWGNYRCFPMFYSWQKTYQHIHNSRKHYDCIIRSRYDLSAPYPISLDYLNMNRINISNWHWTFSAITDDNLCVLNKQNADRLFLSIFDDFIDHSRIVGTIRFAEYNFMKILRISGLYHLVTKSNRLPFKILKDDKLWY